LTSSANRISCASKRAKSQALLSVFHVAFDGLLFPVESTRVSEDAITGENIGYLWAPE
jgi:hypothetical protein